MKDEYAVYLSNFTRSGRAFFQYLVGLCPNLNIDCSSSLYFDDIFFNKIKKEITYITIVRDPRDTIPSAIINEMVRDSKRVSINQTIMHYQRLYVDFYGKLLNKNNLIIIDFNDLINEPEKTMKAIHRVLKIEFVMNQRDKKRIFDENGHIHTSKIYQEYDKVKTLSNKKDYSPCLKTMNEMLQKKLQLNVF